MNKAEQELVNALLKIRDSTFRNAASLRAIADEVINRYKSGDFNESKD